MTVTVKDFLASQRIESQFDHVIGMLDKSEQWRSEYLKKIPNRSMFWFDDVLEGEPGFPPTAADVSDIIQLIRMKELDDGAKSVLVHCAAGISRSTAVAIGLLIMRGFSVPTAWEIVRRDRRMMWPNDTILRHFDNILRLDGKLIKHNADWKKAQSKRDGLIGFDNWPNMF